MIVDREVYSEMRALRSDLLRPGTFDSQVCQGSSDDVRTELSSDLSVATLTDDGTPPAFVARLLVT